MQQASQPVKKRRADVSRSSARPSATRRRLISYFRFSDRRQGKGTSIERQTEGARTYAMDHDLVFDESLTIRDLGKSAFKGKHLEGAFGAFLEAIRQGKVEAGTVLYVESLDRLSRQSALTAMAQLTLIVESDITLVTGGDNNTVYNKATVEANSGILFLALGTMMRANDESKQKSIRANGTLKLKCENWEKGERGFYIPAGINPSWVRYVKDRDLKDGEQPHWEIIEAKAAPIRAAIRYFRAGIGGQSIIERLKGDGYGVADGLGNSSRIYQLMRNRILTGEKSLTVKGHRYILKDYYPALLTEAEFASLQYLIDQRGRRVTRGEFPGILTGAGLACCGYCRNPFSAQNMLARDGQTWHRRLRCMGNAKAEKECRHATVKATPIERAIVRYCSDQVNLSTLLEGNDPRKGIEGQLALARGEVRRLEGEMKNLMRSLAKCADEIQREFFEQESGEIARDLKKKREEVAHLDRELANAQSVAIPAAAELWRKIAHSVDTLDTDDRLAARELLHETFRRINVYSRGFPARADRSVIVVELISRRDTSRVLEINGKTGELLREAVELADLTQKPVAPVARSARSAKR